MDVSKYNRQVTLLCPTCGGTQFEHEEGSFEVARCASCQRETTKDELIRENSENISKHVDEMGSELTEELSKELTRAFSGIKNIKIR